MNDRPYVIISAAQSLDGYINDTKKERLILSNDEDFDKVDALRASVDAILVGANTVRADNPRLMVRSELRRKRRVELGLSSTPLRVVLAGSNDLEADSKLFSTGDDRVVYCQDDIASALRTTLGERAEVVGLGDQVAIPALLSDLYQRGVRRLMVEGGSSVLKQFLTSGLVDEIQLATAGFFVGDSQAPRFAAAGDYPWSAQHRLKLAEVVQLGDVIRARYLTPQVVEADRHWMQIAIDESRKCPPSETAYSVGAVIVSADGRELARGYSREKEPSEHAEEAALRKVPRDLDLAGATVYSTLEPCSKRTSRPISCTAWLLRKPIARVVFALAEPLYFVDCDGAEQLRAADITVDVLDEFADEFRTINAHILKKKAV